MQDDLLEKRRKEAVLIAQGILRETIDIIEGCRRLCQMRYNLGIDDLGVFLPIVDFESQTDEFPVGDAQKAYGREFLDKAYREIEDYVEYSRPMVYSTCEKLIEVFNSPR